MEAAFERLTIVQQMNINKKMFVVAYNCVVKSKGDPYVLECIVDEETEDYPNLRNDLIRYCKLVQSVM